MRLHWIELLAYFSVSQSGSGACCICAEELPFHPFQEHKITLHVRIFGILLLVLVDFSATSLKTFYWNNFHGDALQPIITPQYTHLAPK
jgi:hypothetical protein